MIYEVVITTSDSENRPHVAPMGITYEDEMVILKPFKPSRTLENILSSKYAVMNITTDVKIFAACITGRNNFELINLDNNNGFRLKNATSHLVLKLNKIIDNETRPQLFMMNYSRVENSSFIGLNRAQAAVIEGSILASRLHMLSQEKIISEMKYLKIAIEKTAGPNEKEAWSWLEEKVNNYFKKL
ncbi:MAG: tetrahydromethanopterin synthesis protein [Betaproteobacteria bacterium TMED156]|nr:MAG: tetrahydromethanopterin synthesis protein [Betaproteobacteria bacterium TMED156]|tara:strand:- start:17 stop:574 length:558 start_codon:yes stop_codon:yes gene_type:complete